MKYLKLAATLVLLAGSVSLSFACGSLWAEGNAAPVAKDRIIYVDKLVPVPVEVHVEREWDKTLVLGLTLDGTIEELDGPIDGSDYAYLVTVKFDVGDYPSEITVWIPFDENGTLGGIGLAVWATEYHVSIERGGAIGDVIPEEGDEF